MSGDPGDQRASRHSGKLAVPYADRRGTSDGDRLRRAGRARQGDHRAPSWPVELHTLPALLHNRPRKIAPWAERLAAEALAHGQRVAVAYADCGTYGALDDVCARLGLRRLPGLHCYDVSAGAGPRTRAVRGRARHVPANRLPGAQFRPDRAGRARPGPVPGPVAGLLRSLPPGGLARPGPDRRTGSRSGARRGAVRPAADRGRDRAHPAGTGARAAGRRVTWPGPRARLWPQSSITSAWLPAMRR